jgi:hypothetical protein
MITEKITGFVENFVSQHQINFDGPFLLDTIHSIEIVRSVNKHAYQNTSEEENDQADRESGDRNRLIMVKHNGKLPYQQIAEEFPAESACYVWTKIQRVTDFDKTDDVVLLLKE